MANYSRSIVAACLIMAMMVVAVAAHEGHHKAEAPAPASKAPSPANGASFLALSPVALIVGLVGFLISSAMI